MLIELKRYRTQRGIIAQALDYASRLELSAEKIERICLTKTHSTNRTRSSSSQPNSASTERIVSYLNARDIAINVVFFQVFGHGGQQLRCACS